MKLVVHFFGQCAFIADQPWHSETRMTSVLVDSRKPTTLQAERGMRPHKPCLLYRKNGKWVQEELDRQELIVTNIDPNAHKKLKVRKQIHHGREVPDPGVDYQTIWWLADMARMHRPSGSVASDVLVPAGSGVSSKVVGRVRMPLGGFQVDDLASYEGKFFRWTFSQTAVLYRQALAIKCRWEVELDSDKAELELLSFDSPTTKHLSIGSGVGGQVEIIVGNLSEDGLKAVLNGGKGAEQNIDSDLDFQWFYELVDNPPTKRPYPVPEPSVRGETGKALNIEARITAEAAGGGPVRCPSARFSHDEQA